MSTLIRFNDTPILFPNNKLDTNGDNNNYKHKKNNNDMSLLYTYAIHDDISNFKQMIETLEYNEQCRLVNLKDDKFGWSPLHFASAFSSVKIVSYLINKKANLNSLSNQKRTPLMVAMIGGKYKVLRLLLQAGVDPYDKHLNGGYNVFNFANNLIIRELLLEPLLVLGEFFELGTKEGIFKGLSRYQVINKYKRRRITRATSITRFDRKPNIFHQFKMTPDIIRLIGSYMSK